MEIYLAGEHPVKNGKMRDSWNGLNILESFVYARRNKHIPRLIGTASNFLLDSGAFTFMQGSQIGVIDWNKYVDEYSDFINHYDIKHFFELDIDSIVGVEQVKKLRTRLETRTGKQPIVVWHKIRGKDGFIEAAKNYPYIAIGSPMAEKAADEYISRFPWFINTAHEYGAKIHGLGFTRLNHLRSYKFDSVDSTAWLYGNLSGTVYRFNHTDAKLMESHKREGVRLKDSNEVASHNFNEWIKLMKYARQRL